MGKPLTRLPSNRIAPTSSSLEPDRAWYVGARTGSRLGKSPACHEMSRVSRNVIALFQGKM